MSLGMPTLRPKDVATSQDNTQISGEYNVIKPMSAGLVSSVKDQNQSSVHPLQYSEANWQEQREKIEFMTARNMQGLHMPMKLSMERFAAKQIGRLPCMATRTSNLMHDTLTGRDEMIDADDVFSCPAEFPERSGNIHAIMEKRQGIF